MKRSIRIIILAFVIFITALGFDCNEYKSSAEAAEASGDYVALGDSITSGYGLGNVLSESYVAQTGNMLKVTNRVNLGVSGMNSTQMLESLKTAEVQAVLGKASVITVSIGSNDILGPFTAYVAQAFGTTDLSKIGTILASGDVSTLAIKISALDKLLKNDATNPTGMTAGAAKFAQNYPQIISLIKTSAPGAAIYVNNLYNPYRGISVATLNLGELTDGYITKINNNVFSNASADYNLVDVYTPFNTVDGLVNASISTYNFDPHPNVNGHLAIATKYLEVIGIKSPQLFKTLTDLMADSNVKDLWSSSVPVQSAGAVTIKSAVKSKSSTKAKVILKKASKVTGYQVKVSYDKSFKKAVKSSYYKKTSIQIKKLKKNKTYYVKARSYIVTNGKKQYGKWSKVVKMRQK